METRKLHFINSRQHSISAYLDLPIGGFPDAYAIYSPCFTCTKNLKCISSIARALTAQNLAVLRFDFTGLGESSGDFIDTSFTTNVQDIVDAARFLTAEYSEPQLLIGHSLGGTASIAAANDIPSVKAIATIAAPSSPAHLLRHFSRFEAEIEAKGYAEVKIGGQSYPISKQLVSDLAMADIDDVFASLSCALLIMHAQGDETVGIENAGKLFEKARHPKSFISLDKSDHLLMTGNSAHYVGQMIASWSGAYLITS
ncbi:MAG: alpha/beta hydrolase [Gammaproteobacteria bacterium]